MTWRSVRWSEPRSSGWDRDRWLEETLELDGSIWFSRRSRNPTGELPVFVMVHGLVVSGSYFQPLVSDMDPGWRIHVPDLPGFGRSSDPSKFESVRGMADSLANWCDLTGIEHAVFVGNSMGCQVVTCLAIARPDLVDRYVLVSPTMDPAAKSILHIAIRALRDVPRERQSLWKIWIGDLIRAGPKRALVTLRVALDDPQLDRLGRVRQRGIVIGGEHDPIVPPTWVEALAAQLGDTRAIIVPGAAHALNFSAPKDIARLIRAATADD